MQPALLAPSALSVFGASSARYPLEGSAGAVQRASRHVRRRVPYHAGRQRVVGMDEMGEASAVPMFCVSMLRVRRACNRGAGGA
jgi:hypothetical protein